MSYDRYVAICKPLHYTTIMSNKVCTRLVISSWVAGFLVIFPPVIMGLQLDFCDSNIIDHFTCDSSPLLLIACTDTEILQLMAFFLAIFTLILTLALVILSYTLILRTILKIPSAQQRKKAFSTCSSHDRYVAICKPLHYTTIMSNKVCTRLVISSWVAGFLIIFPPVIMGLQLDFCDSNIIDHFTCDSSPMLLIACTDTEILELMAFFLAVFTLMLTLALVILSYTLILRTVLKIPSAQQRKKAFSTCSSHMIVVSISYGSCIFMYVKTSAKEGVALSKAVAVLNTSVAPMLNPFIYTLRNQQVKQVLKDFTKKILSNKH
ncbi:Olfactory receptor 6C65 [Tupaia chinensis]|uniref:Olfactory receptor 6C65 n=1 Tax=Tupaia chinensis TaxID=246437 RepID=L8YEP8_TUPCH|nr:Olfactory receptor 6C65 [Tupaia chinensis]